MSSPDVLLATHLCALQALHAASLLDVENPVSVAEYLLSTTGLRTARVAEALVCAPGGDEGFAAEVLSVYVNVFEFGRLSFVDSLRHLFLGADFPSVAVKNNERGNGWRDAALRKVATAFARKFMDDYSMQTTMAMGSPVPAFFRDERLLCQLVVSVLELNALAIDSGCNNMPTAEDFVETCLDYLTSSPESQPRQCLQDIYASVVDEPIQSREFTLGF